MRATLALACAAGCGAPPVEAPPLAAPSLDATPASPGDWVVARVDGRPVYASCVAAQAGRDHLDARGALRECIDFELLAGEAARRGLAATAEVRDARRDAMVNRVVERDFEDRAMAPADFGPLWDKLVARLAPRIDHPEFRASSYVRVVVAKGAPAGVDDAARAAATQIAAAVAGQTGLMGVDLVDIAAPIAAAAHVELTHADVAAYTPDGLERAYADALFALPEVGRASPAVRTSLGWDVVVFTEDIPAHHVGADELARAILPDARKAAFLPWIDGLARSMKLTISVDKDAVDGLEDAP